jgi:hypothetical protein
LDLTPFVWQMGNSCRRSPVPAVIEAPLEAAVPPAQYVTLLVTSHHMPNAGQDRKNINDSTSLSFCLSCLIRVFLFVEVARYFQRVRSISVDQHVVIDDLTIRVYQCVPGPRCQVVASTAIDVSFPLGPAAAPPAVVNVPAAANAPVEEVQSSPDQSAAAA